MKIKLTFMSLTLILVLLISGCKENDYQPNVGVCPQVLSTIPTNGAVGVPLRQVISVTFNSVMNESTITSSSFTVIDATKSAELKSAVVLTGAITYSGKTAFFTPSVLLTPKTTYTCRVTTAIHDKLGSALQADYVWTFSIDTPPTVNAIPLNNAVNVPLNSLVVANFSVPMDTLVLKAPGTVFTLKQGTTVVAGTYAFTSTSVTFSPTANLAPFTLYSGAVTTGFKNAIGTPMAADYLWSFTTIPMVALTANPLPGGTVTGAGSYAQGSNVTVLATANLGYTFFNWSEGATIASTSASYQFAMAGNKALVANFTPVYTVSVSSNPVLGGTTSGTGTFSSGTTVTVNALPNSGFSFTNWTEGVNVVSTNSSYQFAIAANRILVANYAPIPYTVSVSSNPVLGGTSVGTGIFNSGSTVTVTASPNTGYTFTNWTEGINIVSTSTTFLFTIAGNRTLVANYASTPYTLNVSSVPILGGTTTGGGNFGGGALVTVKAVPNAGFAFINWTEGAIIVSTLANYPFTITGNRTLVANYIATPFTVNVSSSPILGGITTGGGSFSSGAMVTVNALANAGYTFNNWTEGVTIVSTLATYPFTITGNRTLVANYTASAGSFTLNITAVNGTVAKVPNLATYLSGSTVVLTATPAAGYKFSSWSVDAVGIVSPITVTMNSNKNITANFTLLPPFVPVVDLKSAGNYGILSGVGISNNAGFSIINNMDVGISPGARSSITGFPPAIVVAGALYAADDGGAVAAALTLAKLDLTSAYLAAEGAVAPAPVTVSGDQGGKTLAPGIYKSTSTLLIQAGNLTLDGGGDPNASWIFQVASAFTTVGGAGGSVILTGGAQAKNIFWQTGSSAVIGDYTTFYGNVLALQSITMNSHATIVGRILCINAAIVLTHTNIINKP